MSVYKHRDSPYWRYDFQLSNRRYYGTTAVPKERPKREAEAFETAERRRAIELSDIADREDRAPMTLERACVRWWDEVEQYTAETDLKDALEWVCAQIGPRRLLHDIRNDDVAITVAERRKAKVKAGRDDKGTQLTRPVSARTVNRTVTKLLRRVMNRARDSWDIVVIRMPEWGKHLLKEKKRPIREITLDEEDRIEDVDREGYRAIREFATLTGLRLREVLLTWPQVDFDNALIRLVAKGDVPRIVPLSRRAYAILWAERGRHSESVFTFVAARTRACPHSGQKYVRGQRYPITYFGLTSHRRRSWPKAGVNARWHDLRHTAGMRTLRATGNLKAVQNLLGHSDIATTSKFYVDALVDDVRATMEKTQQDVDSRRKSRDAAADGDKTLTKKA
jgi:site-specific recombinase XerD